MRFFRSWDILSGGQSKCEKYKLNYSDETYLLLVGVLFVVNVEGLVDLSFCLPSMLRRMDQVFFMSCLFSSKLFEK